MGVNPKCSSDGNDGESDGDRVGDANGDVGGDRFAPDPEPDPSLWEEYPDSSAFNEFISANEVPKLIQLEPV